MVDLSTRFGQLEVPNFGAALATHIGQVPPEAAPAFLAGLERSAAQRYRGWATDFPANAEVLMACAEREDEIAREVGKLFPISPALQADVDAHLPAAVETYYKIFEPFAPIEQLFLQSEAELQGAAAWERYASETDEADAKRVLAHCNALERESSRAVKQLLEEIA